ncbi:hypothetical protein LOTGIDRAFT_159343 [Lottia gigantea]|uniref:Uncharacterized protein n=1 Tax=Lottia gigantea TaxID=225164 RepID=V4C6M8_LOTGI|nr:hypothetical protein LOTGIDRAFT_159343 [Lottia gigantea]ESO97319.1 hypothetical protein LOTGIDRAFT_159343 [Lottia gigantea]
MWERGAYDNTIKVISVESGKLIKSFDIEGNDPENVRFCNNDETLIVTCDDFALAVRCQTGLKQYTLKWKDKGTVGICGENKEMIGVFGGTMVVLHDAATGKMPKAVECDFMKEKELSFATDFPCVGRSKRYIWATLDDDNYKRLSASFYIIITNIFETYKNSDGDDTQDTVNAMVISLDCQHIIVSTMKNDLLIYDITNMELVRQIQVKHSRKGLRPPTLTLVNVRLYSDLCKRSRVTE